MLRKIVILMTGWLNLAPALSAEADICPVTTIGHRGSSYLYPENTLASIEQAFREGAQIVEVDVRLSADRIPVLMHDTMLNRTTNGRGRSDAHTLAQLRLLDAGSWKSPRFRDERVPTLAEALKRAAGKGPLYLDIKVPGMAEAIRRVVARHGFAHDSILIAVNSIDRMQRFHQALPDTPLVWFGGIPEDWENAWFELLRRFNVTAIEVYWPVLRETADIRQFATAAARHHIALWTYILNDITAYRQARAAGVTGIETDVPQLLHQYACHDNPLDVFRPQITGAWNFAHGDLRALSGSPLRFLDRSGQPQTRLRFGTTADFKIPSITGQPSPVLFVDALQPHQGIAVYPNIHHRGRGSGRYINRYTVLMDILRPAASRGKWQALLQTSSRNRNDADLFINPDNAIGISDVYHGRMDYDRWYRLAVTVDLESTPRGKLVKYLDGRPIGENILDGPDGRWSIPSTIDSLPALFFSDDDGETAPLYINALQIRDYVMTHSEVAALGGPETAELTPY